MLAPIYIKCKAAVPPEPNFLCTRVVNLERNSEGFLFIEKFFMSWMGLFATEQNVLHIHRYVPNDASAKLRLDGFKNQMKITEELRGNANVKHGWYGAGKQYVVSVLVHSFQSDGNLTKGGVPGGGLYPMPESRAFASVNQCDDDEKGLHYMILCRIILGNIEQIQEGSKQHCPSNQLYDSGVDDLYCPKFYLIWSARLKMYIHPEYASTFKFAPDVEEYLSGLKDSRFHLSGRKIVQDFLTRYPGRQYNYKSFTSPWVSFTNLLSRLQRVVSPRESELLSHHYNEMKALEERSDSTAQQSERRLPSVSLE